MATNTATQPKDLWCATCGTFQGTTDHPFPPVPHRPRFARAGLCHDTDTFTDD